MKINNALKRARARKSLKKLSEHAQGTREGRPFRCTVFPAPCCTAAGNRRRDKKFSRTSRRRDEALRAIRGERERHTVRRG